MKKSVLISGVLFCGLKLGGCGASTSKNNNLKALRTEHAKLLKETETEHHKHKDQNKKHSVKANMSAQQSSSSLSNKNSSSNNNKLGNQNKKNQSNSSANKPQQNNLQQGHQSSQQNNSSQYIDPAQQENVNRGLYPNGTRRPESFANMDDYKRYNAWYQGYNYDPSTNTYTEMNQQQLNNMRNSMNKDGGQDFK